MDALGALGLLLLVTHVAAHVAVCLAVGRERLGQGVCAFFLPPLAVVWGWKIGARRRVGVDLVALGAFAAVVVAIRVLR
jgi:hypothetical protein